MKVTKPGKLPDPKVFIGTCSNCKAQVEVTTADKEYCSSKDGRNYLFPFCECPTSKCGHTIGLFQKPE